MIIKSRYFSVFYCKETQKFYTQTSHAAAENNIYSGSNKNSTNLASDVKIVFFEIRKQREKLHESAEM